MTAQPSSPFDFSPMLKTYMESVELWKKNYENMMKSAKDMQGALGANEAAQAKPSSAGASASDAALLNWRKSGEEVFKRFVENQIELCHFFGSRWRDPALPHLSLCLNSKAKPHNLAISGPWRGQ